MPPRSLLRRLAALTACGVICGSALAQSLPAALRIVVPFPAGGTADILPRLVAEKLRPNHPAGVVVENRSGAGGNIGADVVYRADPDGGTLLASPPGPIAINHHLYPRLGFDPTRWVPVTVLATVPNVLAVSPKLPVTSVAELIAYLKAHPGKVSYASQGNGSTSHLTANLFMNLTGTQMVHVPYKGTAPALVDLIGGQVDVFFDNLSSSATHHRAGKLRILAVADEARSQALPEVPTFVESGLKDMQAVTWFAVVAPPGTPEPLVRAHHQAMSAALAQADVKQKFAEQGADARGWSPEQAARFIRTESDKWHQVIKTANVKME
ncbi:Bug family tripartite tricarboxylate transporter substrate binding protein [Caldimonas caldifontis]|uniref:Tripartite tricarboxylate transporter substrate binding protein n=1 Tax=Caldimonas caldifontis TaxID=1452508 RepID=A0A2S5SXB4_9BURK|nr:tripartite tricarboxylate transporter substrate binding protein [Caldimonas caldifontis]PPE67362.1 tripartite tricarboxylate transporter substrate binding protein [Caldimonas caldifontis]